MKSHFIIIPLPLYHLHVVIAHGCTIEQCYAHLKKLKYDVDDELFKDLKDSADSSHGLCTNLGKDNLDVLVWLARSVHRDSDSSEYGPLWHELFHAVLKIQRNLGCTLEEEFGAYLFEHLAESACNVFWRTKPPKERKKK